MAGFRTHLWFYKAVLATALPVLLCGTAPVRAEEELCMDGTLLFREDFGGNDPNDPRIQVPPEGEKSTVPGMSDSYQQLTTDAYPSMGSGRYLVTKSGYCNGDTTGWTLPGADLSGQRSQWYIQDDHTYPDDYSRGYFLEIDGSGGSQQFYETEISGLCAGSELTFSAYVANVFAWFQYDWHTKYRGPVVAPGLKFVLTDPTNGTVLAAEEMPSIPFDESLPAKTDWQYSSTWHLVGMNFTVPTGVEAVRLSIYNNVNNGNGNDFALDDIEIRLCAPPISIIGPEEVCHGEDLVLRTEFTNDGTFTSPQYLWYHSRDSINWYEIPLPFKDTLPLPNIQWGDSGWFKVAVASADRIRLPNCRSESKPFYLHVKDCPSDLCMDGTLLFREDFGGNSPDDPGRLYSLPEELVQSLKGCSYKILKQGTGNNIQWHKQDDHTYFGDFTRGYFAEIDGCDNSEPFFTKKIDNLCTGTKLTLSAYVTNLHHVGQLDYFKGNYVYPRVKFVFRDPETNQELASHATGDIRPDYSYLGRWTEARENLLSAEWQLVGMTFEIPEGMNSVQMEIYNDVRRNGNGNDFALDDIEIHICLPPVKIVSEPEACEGSPHTFKADFTNDGSFAEPLEYKWYFSADSLTWTELPEKTGTLTYAKCQKTEHEGWYRAAVADSENIDKENCRAMSEPFRLRVKDDCEPPKEELCMDGTLLFREDFGGNDPSDPRLVSTPADIQGMTYEQLLTDRFGTMKSGGFLITKEGYCNGDTSVTNPTRGSQWHLQDDHTYPGDKTRGYFLEIDGRGDHAAFYTRTIDMLCEGTRLTFSAYVANVVKWNEYTGRPGYFAYPRLEFVLTDPDGNKLKSYDTGDIPFDSTYLNDFSSWQYSSKWHLVGMNFEVPEGVSSVTLTIYNNVEGWIGNDFALDDIEIRLCVPPVTIEGPNEVCLDAKPTLTAHFDNDGTFSNPDYQWYFSTDSAGFYNEIDPAMALTYTIENAQKADEGWYRIGISERGQMAYMNCRAISEPFHLTVKECEPPEPDPDLGLCNNGILLFREDFGGNDPSDPDVNCDLTEGVRYRNACQTPDNIEEGHYLITKRGKGYYENQWLERDDHTYPNDFSRGYYLVVNASNNRLFYSIELPGGESGSEFSFSAYVISLNESIFGDEEGTYYRYPSILFDFVNGSTFERIAAYPVADMKLEPSVSHSKRWHLVGTKFTLPKDIPYIVLNAYTSMIGRMGNDFGLDDIEFRLCRTPIEQHADTTVCDTLLPLDWRGRLWENEGTLIDTLRYTDGEDSVYIHISLHTKNCCQEAQLVKADTTLCGYALPFVWHDAVFDRPSTQTVIEKNERGCDTFVYTLTVDTVYCVRRYPIIVNKYNWVLLVDNIAVRRLFPDKTPVAYQWYKDDEPIAGATEDDYSEQNELHGVFSMLLHFADGSSVWSNIIDLSQTPTAAQVRVKAYNSSGILVREWQATDEQGGLSLPPGIYLLRYEGGDEVFTEKRIVP